MSLLSPIFSQKVSDQNIAIFFSIVKRQITLHLEMTRPPTVSGEGPLSYKFCPFLSIVFVIKKCAFIFRIGARIF